MWNWTKINRVPLKLYLKFLRYWNFSVSVLPVDTTLRQHVSHFLLKVIILRLKCFNLKFIWYWLLHTRTICLLLVCFPVGIASHEAISFFPTQWLSQWSLNWISHSAPVRGICRKTLSLALQEVSNIHIELWEKQTHLMYSCVQVHLFQWVLNLYFSSLCTFENF